MMNYPNIDSWKRENPTDAFVYTEGKNVKMNLEKIIPNSRSRFRKEDVEIAESLETFIIERKLFFRKIEVLCQYIDYFVEFFDDDKELPMVYLSIKDLLDSTKESLTMDEFRKTLLKKFFQETGTKRNIYRLVDANYDLDVTVDQKTGRVFTGSYDFTNDEAKILYAISIYMKMIIPITSQYISTNTLYTTEELSKLITDVFVDGFYYMGNHGDNDADSLMVKLYKFTEDKILKHYGANQVLWQQQCALRGLTETKHIDTILIKHLLSNNMFKFQFDNNIISFLKSIVETQLICTINKVKYKANPTRVDNVKDFNGLTGLDKLEQSLAKLDESQVIRCNKSAKDTIARLLAEFGEEITTDEIDYYTHNFIIESEFHSMLFGYYYAKTFDGYMEIKNLDLISRVKLLILAKRQLIRDGNQQLPWLFTSVIKGRTSARLLQNTKFINKLTSSQTYNNVVNNKYTSLKGFREDEILSILSRVLNNIYTYVEYDNQELTGEEIVFDEDIICQEMLDFIDNI